MGWRPILLTGMIRDLLIRNFQGPGNIRDADLRNLVWRPDERTGIMIESVHRWRGSLAEKRPAILIKRNAMQNLRLTIGDKAGIDEQGQSVYMTMWTGSHTLFCIHGSGASVEILASEVQKQITQFAPVLVEYLGLHRITVTEVGTVSELEEAKQDFAITVTVGWAYEELWKLELESLKLRKIPLSILLDGALINSVDNG
jgi:hypothetical protein